MGQKGVAVIKDILIMRSKFQIDRFKKELITFHPHPLHHNVSSKFWGTGGKGDSPNITGKILMELRDELQKQAPQDSPHQPTQQTQPVKSNRERTCASVSNEIHSH